MYPKILIFTDWFLPGFRGGGPIKSMANFSRLICSEYEVFIVTRNTDFGTTVPYAEIPPDIWLTLDQRIKVMYLSDRALTITGVLEIIRNVRADFWYLNSMYSFWFSVLPLLFKKIFFPEVRLVLSPRGMLKNSAVSRKAFKKKLYLSLLSFFQFQRAISFHAVDEQEKKDITKFFGSKTCVWTIPNVPSFSKLPFRSLPKDPGALKIIFVGRIHPIKNLDYCLKILKSITEGAIEFSIYGVLEDLKYWSYCESLIRELPKNIIPKFGGEIAPDKVDSVLVESHVLFLPTQGENFGHVIFESFQAGRPVLISDQTPWKGLQAQHLGWEISLANHEDFIRAIVELLNLSQSEFDRFCKNTHQFAQDYRNEKHLISMYSRLFSKNAD